MDSDSVIVTLFYTPRVGGQARKDLELPREIPIQQLLRGLAVGLGLLDEAQAFGAQHLPYRLARESASDFLENSRTLRKSRIIDGEKLWLVSVATLIAPSGREFILAQGSTVIGRQSVDGGTKIDLSDEEGAKGIHRVHAHIRYTAGRWSLMADYNATRPTLVNDRDIKPGQPVSLVNGDRIRLGKTIVLQFVCG